MLKVSKEFDHLWGWWRDKFFRTLPSQGAVTTWFSTKGCTTWADRNIEDPVQAAAAAQWPLKEMADLLAFNEAFNRQEMTDESN